MKKDIKINLPSLKAKLRKFMPAVNKHGAFAAIIVVLFVYLFIVWKISVLASAEPSDDNINAALTSSAVPNINKSSIQKIEALEQNSPQVKSLFNQARNNPFQE